MKPSEKIDQRIASIADWRGKVPAALLRSITTLSLPTPTTCSTRASKGTTGARSTSSRRIDRTRRRSGAS